VEEDLAESVKWWQKAVEQGHNGAMQNLAGCYRYGEGVERDEAEAARWDERRAEAA
jgi:TPR repeat protein